MDAHDELLIGSEISYAVLGRGEDFVLIRLDPAGLPFDEELIERARTREFAYCGVLGVLNGQAGVRIAADNLTAPATMLLAGLAFAREVADRLRPQPKGDEVDWLTTLFELPDTRTALS